MNTKMMNYSNNIVWISDSHNEKTLCASYSGKCGKTRVRVVESIDSYAVYLDKKLKYTSSSSKEITEYLNRL